MAVNTVNSNNIVDPSAWPGPSLHPVSTAEANRVLVRAVKDARRAFPAALMPSQRGVEFWGQVFFDVEDRTMDPRAARFPPQMRDWSVDDGTDDGGARFGYLFLLFRSEGRVRAAQLLLVDRFDLTAERFDPYGGDPGHPEYRGPVVDDFGVDSALTHLFTNRWASRDGPLVYAGPDRAFGALPLSLIGNDGALAWIAYYLVLRLSNPGTPRANVYRHLLVGPGSTARKPDVAKNRAVLARRGSQNVARFLQWVAAGYYVSP